MKIGFAGLLTILLIVLKIAGCDISWTFVFAPLWIPALIGLIAAVLLFPVWWWFTKDKTRKDD